MSFDVAADSYDRFMGCYSVQLSAQLADYARVAAGQTAIDVGCGPGALTAELVARLGTDAVAAVDPSEPFVEAARARHPGVDVQQAAAESLPYPDGAFDAAVSQLVVHFMSDPVAGIAEMARVTKPGGVVAACVWDFAGGRAPISPFWQAVLQGDTAARDESGLPGVRAGHLAELFAQAGLVHVEETELSSAIEYATFDEWWEPYTFGVGPVGAYLGSLDESGVAAVRDRCRALLPDAPFTVAAYAWAVRATV